LSFIAAFFASLLGTNLIVPAGAITTALGVLAGSGVISPSFAIWAAVGAALGTSTTYSLSRRYGGRALQLQMIASRPLLVARARTIFHRYGVVAILIGYFAGPLRAIVASLAGIALMHRPSFEIANVISAGLWALSSLAIGMLPGALIRIDSVLLPIAMVAVPVLSLAIPGAIVMLKRRRTSQSEIRRTTDE
jgi:membrane protein DedA with SNARE-associated domain